MAGTRLCQLGDLFPWPLVFPQGFLSSEIPWRGTVCLPLWAPGLVTF